ncbi:hypothetical protein CYY_008637 [Polysphondylium violaceum]|uniref:NADH dehydrogenase [ubiquinone] 1 beta subcomplex subunit 7 n=1 Tax=Polysphondylium violaceum TaxID=133409 RepID=A0A8J4PP03_9MYCE|nr:hypothetical protein CYY_008637 [Polysphondylium violaceum]
MTHHNEHHHHEDKHDPRKSFRIEDTFVPGGNGERIMIATQKELDENNIPLNYRDYCSHLLIELNKCRLAGFFLPWECSGLKHAYEQCQAAEYFFRQHKKQVRDYSIKEENKKKAEEKKN